MGENHSDILVIGAGMAGLTCATQLAETGRDVRVLDKGRGPGGRMAARRAEVAGEINGFDHGAQYFTARDEGFREAVAQWVEQGVVAKWGAAGDDAWVGAPGMNGPIRAMADAVTVHWGVRAESIARDGQKWVAETDDAQFTADTLIVAVPAEQAQVLLADAAPDLASIAGSVDSEPCWAVMAGFAAPLAIGEDAIRSENGAISWAARNSAKPARKGVENWVIHASPARSREIIDRPKEEAATLLLDDFFAQTGAAAVEPIHLVAHRWLYAMPAAASGDPARFDAEARIGIAGDYLHSPRVEGAWISGSTLAKRVLASS